MPQYLGLSSILDAALGEYKDQGFRLEEYDDHAMFLYHNDKKVAVLSSIAATIKIIHEACQEYLDGLKESK